MMKTIYTGFVFKPLDLSSMRLGLINSASFTKARDEKIQLRYFLLMTDATGNANIVHYIYA